MERVHLTDLKNAAIARNSPSLYDPSTCFHEADPSTVSALDSTVLNTGGNTLKSYSDVRRPPWLTTSAGNRSPSSITIRTCDVEISRRLAGAFTIGATAIPVPST